MRLATWNINSVRLRIKKILNFVKNFNIDVLCLQETKTVNDYFPIEDFKKNGYQYSHFIGQKSYNGVAILSKIPIVKKAKLKWCNISDARHVSVKLENNVTIHNFYIPSGGDIPDIKKNPKFKHKLDFLKEMIIYFSKDRTSKKVLVGDLNIAPGKYDVWSHTQLLNVVSYTNIERQLLSKLIYQSKLIDIIRYNNIPDAKLYTWWSYRSKDWRKSDRGRRLDHIFISKDLISNIKMTKICKELRGGNKPSDHVPVITDFDL